MRPCRLGRWGFLLSGALGLLSGCQWFVDDADREVYRLLDNGQPRAIRQAPADRNGPPAVPGPAAPCPPAGAPGPPPPSMLPRQGPLRLPPWPPRSRQLLGLTLMPTL